jgi:hypothetical protein
VHLRVVDVAGPVAQFIEAEPADSAVLAGVGKQVLGLVRPEDEPKGHVRVTGHAPRRRDGEEQRLSHRVESCLDAEFLGGLPHDGVVRVLAVFDVSAGRQPQPRLAVIAQQHAAAGLVERHEVRDEVHGRRVGRDRAEERLAGGDPVQDPGLVGGLPVIERAHARHEHGYHGAERVLIHG